MPAATQAPATPSFKITFLNEKEEAVDVVFRQKPLGFKFVTSSMKVTSISETGCVKENGLNVQVGWKIHAANDNRLSGLEPKEAQEKFLATLKDSLP
mmetsp:Transcript_309/g.641  ORF Transcript_309/g.641 Transcript_309/m.641 type:complete len:97 (-) Transcript_309:204-494(-)